MKPISSLVCGIIFGLGLAVSGMINPAKVLAFLDLFGDWDPSLLLVMGGALAVTALSYRFILRRPSPLLGGAFHIPEKIGIDRRLVIGAVLFGLGWGLVGLCPGPAVASLAYGETGSVVFLIALLAGLAVGRRL